MKTENVTTHRCKVCGCKWILWPAGSCGIVKSWWSMGNDQNCGKCCDNVAMDVQIETLAEAFDGAIDMATSASRLLSDLRVNSTHPRHLEWRAECDKWLESFSKAHSADLVPPLSDQDVLMGVATMLDTLKSDDWRECWSDYDQSIREGLSAMMQRLQKEKK